jgi:hypothetical protein
MLGMSSAAPQSDAKKPAKKFGDASDTSSQMKQTKELFNAHSSASSVISGGSLKPIKALVDPRKSTSSMTSSVLSGSQYEGTTSEKIKAVMQDALENEYLEISSDDLSDFELDAVQDMM